jgi:hypothetical protein
MSHLFTRTDEESFVVPLTVRRSLLLSSSRSEP